MAATLRALGYSASVSAFDAQRVRTDAPDHVLREQCVECSKRKSTSDPAMRDERSVDG